MTLSLKALAMPAESRFVAVSQFEGSVDLLKIDLATRAWEIIPTTEVMPDEVSFGLFEIERDGPACEIVALLATPKGPLLIFKEHQYRPEIGKTTIGLKTVRDSTRFRILHAGEEVFGLSYVDKFGIGLHPYNRKRSDIDFYFWLSIEIDNPKFYEVYTREIRSMG
jgi:hypothetical protein